jgi:hypothetical protein
MEDVLMQLRLQYNSYDLIHNQNHKAREKVKKLKGCGKMHRGLPWSCSGLVSSIGDGFGGSSRPCYT